VTTAAKHYANEAAAIQAARARAPETVKLAGLLWAYAESKGGERYENLALIAATVQSLADRSYNMGSPEVLVVLEAFFKTAGVKL